MSNTWDLYEPAPIEFMHARMIELFHEFGEPKIDSLQMNRIIAKAKLETYEKYRKQNLKRVISKVEM